MATRAGGTKAAGVSSGHGLLEARIARYLEHRMPLARDVAVEGVHRIPGGNSKENLVFRARWNESGSARRRGFLLRRELPAGVLETAVETEYRVMGALRDTDVPVPRMYWYEPDPAWLDRPFMVSELVRGESSPEQLFADPELKRRIARDFVRVLVSQHRFNWDSAGLHFLGVPRGAGDCAQRLLDHWAAVLARHRLDPQPLLAALMGWLRSNQPAEVRRIALLHGDPGPGNFLFRNGRIVAVVDWEMAHLGDPMDDVGWTCWRAARPGGLMEREEFLELYGELSGEPVNRESVRYYEIFSNVRAAIACVSGLHAFCTGQNMQPNMALVGLGVYRRCLLDAAALAGF